MGEAKRRREMGLGPRTDVRLAKAAPLMAEPDPVFLEGHDRKWTQPVLNAPLPTRSRLKAQTARAALAILGAK